MKRILALLGLWPLVWLMDHDGEVNLRVARQFWDGHWRASRVPILRKNDVILNHDHSTTGVRYVQYWGEWRFNRKHVVFTASDRDSELQELRKLVELK